MDKIFAVGDIHGELNKLNTLLTKWNPDNQQLVLLGDLIDRGADSYGVVHLARHLTDTYGAKVVMGNHEELFLSWLDAPDCEKDLYYPQGGRETIHSFFDQRITFTHLPSTVANMLKSQFADDLAFIRNLPYYYDWKDHVFVHAGVNFVHDDWRDTRNSDFCWIRRDFHYKPNHTDKIFVFGHTPTPILNPDKSNDIWFSPCKTKIGIDGGAVFGGDLHGLLVTPDGYDTYSVDKGLHISTRTISHI